jgi:hypothetical protein
MAVIVAAGLVPITAISHRAPAPIALATGIHKQPATGFSRTTLETMPPIWSREQLGSLPDNGPQHRI